LLSILEQAASAEGERGPFGRFYHPLIRLPSDTDLDVILDGASRVLIHKGTDRFELRSLFAEWLKRRLESPAPITPVHLSRWLRNIRVSRHRDPEKALASLKARFEKEPLLFTGVFELLACAVPNEERSFRLFVALDLWQLLPAAVWPVPPCEFFLANAEKENDPEHAADLFRMYLAWFPREGASVALAEAGFDLLDRRRDVAKALGKWQSCKIEKWRKDESKRREKEGRKRAVSRAQHVAYFTPRLTTIRAGGEERGLAWAAMVYQVFFYYIEDVPGTRERLVSVTNDEIADALVEGFIRYAENPTIPKKEAVIQS
jgi:hypothetical protein